MPMEERSLSSEATQEVGKEWRLGNLATPEGILKLQKALHVKVKEEPGRAVARGIGAAAQSRLRR
jgi:hypothetical protein